MEAGRWLLGVGGGGSWYKPVDKKGMAEAAKPRQWQLKWIKADGFTTYLQDESEDFAMTGLGIEESGHHRYHGLSLPNKEDFEGLWTLAGLGPVTLSSGGVLPSFTVAVNGEDLNLTCEYHQLGFCWRKYS